MKQFDEIVRVCFLKKYSFGEKELYELNIKENKEINMDKSDCIVETISPDIAKIKVKKLYEIAKKWDKQYINKSILDGVEYTIIFEFFDGDIFNIYCKNRFPEDFSKFTEIIGGNKYE